jgi:hypothetical protein
MQQVRWYYRVGLLVVALVLAACGDDKVDSESNRQPDNEIPANFSDTSSSEVDGAFSVPSDDDTSFDFSLGNEIVAIEPQTVQAGDGTLLINITMPDGYKFNDLAPFRGDFESDADGVTFPDEWLHYEAVLPTMPLEIPVTFTEGQAMVTADLHIYWCEAVNETLCFVDNQVLTIPVTVDNAAEGSVANAVVALTPPE